MTLVQLRHFLALAECGSFAKASRVLFLTQPALSRSIQALEEELGQPLFDRLGRRLDITAFGQQALQKAKLLVSDADALKRSGQAMQAGMTGAVRIGLGSGPGAMLSIPLMLHMAERYPGLSLTISRGNTDLLTDALRARRIDAAVVDIRSLRPAPDLQVSHQTEMSASFMCRAGHPLARMGRPLRFAELQVYPIASTPLSDEVARLLMERYGPQANPEDMVTLRCDDTPTLVEVARHSDAIVLTIDAAARDLVFLQTDPPLDATARFGLVMLAGRAHVPGMDLVTDFVSKTLQTHSIHPG
jgi:DNA-binding transcriptional LysR family regulator